MSDQPETPMGADPMLQPFMDFWSQYLGQGDDLAKKMMDTINGDADPQVWKRRWLDSVSQSMDAYMRTPAFLQMLRNNADAMMEAKSHSLDLSQEFARNADIPTMSDISGLFERLAYIEHSIIGRLGKIEKRLKSIESKLSANDS